MEQVIDGLISKMTADELWACLEDGSPIDSFYALWGIEYRLYDYMSNYEDYLDKKIHEAWREVEAEQNLILEDTGQLRRLQGWT